jgi:uncharacterized protein YwgA
MESTEGESTMNRRDWALLVIAAGKGRALTPVQLQKCLFLVGQEFQEVTGPDYYDFIAYDYGPFSIDVYRDAETLESEGLVIIQPNKSGRWKEYAASALGLSEAEKMSYDLEPNLTRSIDEIVDWARQLSFQALVKEIYRRYPEFRVNSVFQD